MKEQFSPFKGVYPISSHLSTHTAFALVAFTNYSVVN